MKVDVTKVGPLLNPSGNKPGISSPGSFGNLLNSLLKEVNSSQVKADEALKGFLSGEIQDLHQVVAATEEAKLMFELAVQVRNKVIEAYQEIARMQI
jgi:flagellar hook-basal body complex protein FliE